MNLPNQLTIFRMLVIPFLVAVFSFYPAAWPSALLLVLASLTDWLDGYCARRQNQCTYLGAFLDPVADKLLVVTVLLLLVSVSQDSVLSMTAGLIILREVFISSLREWLALVKQGKKLPVSVSAKLKTALQMCALVLLLLSSKSQGVIWVVGKYTLMFSLVFSIVSLFGYIKVAWPVLTFSENSE